MNLIDSIPAMALEPKSWLVWSGARILRPCGSKNWIQVQDVFFWFLYIFGLTATSSPNDWALLDTLRIWLKKDLSLRHSFIRCSGRNLVRIIDINTGFWRCVKILTIKLFYFLLFIAINRWVITFESSWWSRVFISKKIFLPGWA